MQRFEQLTTQALTGHRLFLDGLRYEQSPPFPPMTCRIAVADDSGELPHKTTDGVLYLDRSKTIIQDDSGYWYLPLQFPCGRSIKTPTYKSAAMYIARLFGMSVVSFKPEKAE